MTIHEEAPAPRVTGSPAAVWLVYGDIDSDCTHAECAEVTWCEDQQHPSDVRYVRADVAEAMAAVERERLRDRLTVLNLALHAAEAALADIGDADREPGDDVAWCEARAAKALADVRAAMAA